MSLLPKIRTIFNSILCSSANIPLGLRATCGSVRGFSKEIDVTNPHVDDFPIELDENPYQKDKIQCILCKHSIEPDYKNVRLLSQFQSRYTGRIYGRHITGLCAKRQKQVENEIAKAQSMGLMPYTMKLIDYVNDPQLFDPDHPTRPHSH
ncbi:28S ribosomal protein S18c, mitochondrial [Leptopilina heterotoma]|uniref:28S ribosomal protein S18c, mitochondrial n=1 Tax=Leptopilina heterotoma TaxID=63436 RepID=UPI001CA7ECDF|nr:28S ribosomal protein S18c, mitochondrial [Leptopilina heterotoma]